jgi:insulysin
VDVQLYSPLLQATPRNAVLGRLFTEMFHDSITEDVYDASLAELSFNVAYGGDHIGISAGGFSDKLPRLLETMTTKMMQFDLDEERFKDIVDDVSWEHHLRAQQLTLSAQVGLDEFPARGAVSPN